MNNRPRHKIITVRYGIGYGEHTTEIEVPEDATADEIDEFARDCVMDRVWWEAVTEDADD